MKILNYKKITIKPCLIVSVSSLWCAGTAIMPCFAQSENGLEFRLDRRLSQDPNSYYGRVTTSQPAVAAAKRYNTALQTYNTALQTYTTEKAQYQALLRTNPSTAAATPVPTPPPPPPPPPPPKDMFTINSTLVGSGSSLTAGANLTASVTPMTTVTAGYATGRKATGAIKDKYLLDVSQALKGWVDKKTATNLDPSLEATFIRGIKGSVANGYAATFSVDYSHDKSPLVISPNMSYERAEDHGTRVDAGVPGAGIAFIIPRGFQSKKDVDWDHPLFTLGFDYTMSNAVDGADDYDVTLSVPIAPHLKAKLSEGKGGITSFKFAGSFH